MKLKTLTENQRDLLSALVENDLIACWGIREEQPDILKDEGFWQDVNDLKYLLSQLSPMRNIYKEYEYIKEI